MSGAWPTRASREAAAVVLAVVVVGSALLSGVGGTAAGAGVSGASAAASTGQPADAEVRVQVTVDRTPDRPGSVRVTVAVTGGTDVTEYVLTPSRRSADRWTVVSMDGFERAGSDPLRFRTTPDAEPSRLVVDVSLPETAGVSRGGVETDEWAFLGLRFRSGYRYRGGTAPRINTSVTVAGEEGTALASSTSVTALVGAHESVTRSLPGQTVELAVPAGVEPASGSAAVFEAIGTASRRLRIGERDRRVLVVTLPGESEDGPAGLGSDAVMQVDAGTDALGGPDNTYVHEYVHTRQAFGTTDTATELRWLVEASASYYDTTLPLTFRNRTMSYADAQEAFTGETVGGPLAEPGSWEGHLTPYERGERVFAVLNQRVFAASNGTHTAATVLRHLNDRARRLDREDSDQRLSAADLRWAVRQTGLDPGPWYEQYVTGTATAEPTSPWAYVVTPTGDPDGDGLTNSQEFRAAADLHPFRPDSDDDGTLDSDEVTPPATLTPRSNITAQPIEEPRTASGTGAGEEGAAGIEVTVSGPGFTVSGAVMAVLALLCLARVRVRD